MLQHDTTKSYRPAKDRIFTHKSDTQEVGTNNCLPKSVMFDALMYSRKYLEIHCSLFCYILTPRIDSLMFKGESKGVSESGCVSVLASVHHFGGHQSVCLSVRLGPSVRGQQSACFGPSIRGQQSACPSWAVSPSVRLGPSV